MAMKIGKKISSFVRSSSKSRSPSLSRSNPSSFSSFSSASEHKETPKSVLPGLCRYPSKEPDGWPDCPPGELHCDFGEVFRILDKDGDGKITRRELEEVLPRLDSAPLTEEEVAFMVSLADADGDGCVTMEEFCALSGPAGESELVGAFRAYDTDGDGRISAEELHCMLMALGDGGCTLDDCRRIIESVDSDGDGFVGFEDFERMLRQPK
ncbi:probable calcium-binding protein CML18 [Nymphaea colorata]|uniref:probable calcium-binding protein CML18 n=1 Tax=Nymphaea colorata TaxID=210225 RepID=UPI00129EBA31|nr:probable calcium-binding protein CML18 [Nymphaea colorata]